MRYRSWSDTDLDFIEHSRRAGRSWKWIAARFDSNDVATRSAYLNARGDPPQPRPLAEFSPRVYINPEYLPLISRAAAREGLTSGRLLGRLLEDYLTTYFLSQP